MIKRILNRSKDYLTALPAIERNRIENLKGKISCLLYHRVEDYGKHQFLDAGGSPVIDENDLGRELSYLKQLPCQFYTLSDLNKGQFPDQNTIGIVICFDDCFRCNYEQGLDVLARHEILAVFFQCTGFFHGSRLIWEHLLYWLHHNSDTKTALFEIFKNKVSQPGIDSNNYISYLIATTDSTYIEEQTVLLADQFGLSQTIQNLAKLIYPDKEQIVNAFDKGHEIASHGHNHYKRETISDRDFKFDIDCSNSLLTELLGQKADSYSYPFNSFKDDDHQRVNQYFTNIAVVNSDRINQPLEQHLNLIPRLTWPGQSPNQYRMKRWLLTGGF